MSYLDDLYCRKIEVSLPTNSIKGITTRVIIAHKIYKSLEHKKGPYVTINDLLGHTSFKTNCGIYNDSIYRFFYRSLFINEFARKNLAEIPESRNFLGDVKELTFLMKISFTCIIDKNIYAAFLM